jgi:hypothetical protein
MEFAADGVGGLLGEFGDVIVTKVLIGHEEEQNAVLLGEFVECDADPLSKFIHFHVTEGTFCGAGGVLDDGVVGLGMDIPRMPAAAEIGAVIEGDPIEPGPDIGIAAEVGEVAPGLDEDVVGGVLGLAGVAEEAEGEVVNLLAEGFVEGSELRRQGGGPG